MKTQEVVTRKRVNVREMGRDDGLSVGWMVFLCVVCFGEQRYGAIKGWLVAFNDFIYFIYCCASNVWHFSFRFPCFFDFAFLAFGKHFRM